MILLIFIWSCTKPVNTSALNCRFGLIFTLIFFWNSYIFNSLFLFDFHSLTYSSYQLQEYKYGTSQSHWSWIWKVNETHITYKRLDHWPKRASTQLELVQIAYERPSTFLDTLLSTWKALWRNRITILMIFWTFMTIDQKPIGTSCMPIMMHVSIGLLLPFT